MREIAIAHRKPEDWTDRVALATVRLLRWGMDLVTGYKHPEGDSQMVNKKHRMTGDEWIRRFIFLESVAGVPGLVGGMLRHLRSLRQMKRDNGWYVFDKPLFRSKPSPPPPKKKNPPLTRI